MEWTTIHANMEGTTKLGQTLKHGFSPTDSVINLFFLSGSKQLVIRKLGCQDTDALNFHQTKWGSRLPLNRFFGFLEVSRLRLRCPINSR